MAQEKFAKVKNWFDDAKKKFNQRITMEGILKQARESFEYFLESRSAFDVEKKISDKLMRDAYGIVLLTEVKVGGLVAILAQQCCNDIVLFDMYSIGGRES
eukprot:272422_1